MERIINMKKRVCLSILLAGLMSAAFAYTYDTKLPLPGKSIAGAEIQRATLFSAYAFAHRIAAQDCTDFSIIDTSVSKEKQDNKWQEIWVIKACERTANVPINFEIRDGKLLYGIDPMGVRHEAFK